ncbi:MAG TPA: ABC transporter permease [Silvibacterium sp.]|nr:ABC transporter permease [Silvibacterium sp.]
MSLRRFFRRRYWDAERVQEFETHIQNEIDDNLARGMTREEARRQAYLKFGNPIRVREEIWKMNSIAPFENFLRDVRYAWRTLLRNPGYALVAVLTLGLGIGANTAIFTVINGVLLKPLPYAQQDRIVHLDQTAALAGPDAIGLSVQEFQDFRDQTYVFSDVAEYHSMNFTLLGTKNPERVATGVVSANFFDVLGVKPVLGRLFMPADESKNAPPVLLLSYAYWMKEFGGDRGIVGRAFELNDRVHTVVGVLPSLPEYPDANEVYMPTTSCPYRASPKMIADRDMRMITAYARLKPGADVQQANTELATIFSRRAAAWPKSYPASAGFAPQIAPVDRELTHAARPTFLTLLGAAGLVLLLACANLANLALSRQMRRAREMAIRMATGASAWNILRQLLTESMLVALAGGVLGLAIAAFGSKLLIAYAARMTPLSGEIRVDGRVLLFGLGISMLTGILFGALPGYVASRVRMTSLTDAGERMAGSESGTRLRNALVAAQVMFSFVLLMCAGLMLRSLYNLLSVDPGFKTANVLSMQVSLNWTKYKEKPAKTAFFRQVLERVEALPGVDSASFSWMVPLNSDMGRMSGDLIFEGQPIHPDQPPPQVDYEVATPDYFHVLGVPVLAGRVFTDRDTLDTPGVAIVNERLAKHYWPNDNPVGHRVSTDMGKTWITVAGVVSDVHQYGLSKEAEDAIYLPVYQFDVANTHLLLRTSRDPMHLANQVAAVIHAIDPQQPVTDVRTLDQLRSAQLGTPKVTAILLGLFAVVALFITVVGVSGTLALSVARRAKEIGIRIALGATKERILGNVLMRGMAPVLAGLVVGAVAAVFATRVLANLLFAVGPNDRLTFVGIAALLLLVALIGCLIPARRAVRVDPMKALRTE